MQWSGALFGQCLRGAVLWLDLRRGFTGSTAGGIRIFRFEVMYVMLKAHFRQLLYPGAVVAKSYGGAARRRSGKRRRRALRCLFRAHHRFDGPGAGLSDRRKMILGRLELFTVLILFYPRFWRS